MRSRVVQRSQCARRLQNGRDVSCSTGGQLDRCGLASGFTLIELLIVVGIIGLLLGILLPSLGLAQRASRKTATTELMRELTVAVDLYRLEKRRNPGVFLPTQLGVAGNEDRGFTPMENMLVGLTNAKLGTVANRTWNAPADDNNILEVGPYDASDTKNIEIDLDIFRSDLYSLGLPSSRLFGVEGQETTVDQVPTLPGTGQAKRMPDLVDNFGMPIMAWVRSPAGALPPQTVFGTSNGDKPFVRFDDNGTGDRASYCLVANAGYLRATALGEKKVQQRGMSLLSWEDWTGGISIDKSMAKANLAAILGASKSPRESNMSMPTAARGGIVLISAGVDRVFFNSKTDATGSKPGKTDVFNPAIGYGPKNWIPNDTSTRNSGTAGYSLDFFDELILSGGN